MYKHFTWKNILKYKFLRNLTLSYTGLVILTVTVITFFLFYFFSVAETTEINKYSEASLKQISFASDLVYSQVTNLSNQLEMDTNLVNFINTNSDNSGQKKIDEYKIFLELTNIKAMYPFITSIGIYRLDNMRYVDTQGIPIDQSILLKHAEQYMYYYPRSVQTYKTDSPKKLITFIRYSNYSWPDSARFAIVINIDQSYILDTISNVEGIGTDSAFLVTNSKGKVLSSTDDNLFLKDLSSVGYVKSVLSSNDSEGSIFFKVNGQKDLIFYVKSNALDWHVISITPYNSYIYNIIQIRNLLLCIFAIIAIIGILIAVLSAQKQYNPMQNLLEVIGEKSTSKTIVDEYKLLSDTFSQSLDSQMEANLYIQDTSQYTKCFCLSALLKGMDKKTFNKELLKIIDKEYTGPCYCVLLIKFDDFLNKKKDDDISLLRFAMQNISMEIFQQVFRADYTQIEENEMVFLLQFTDERSFAEISPMLCVIQEVMHVNFSLSFSAAIGKMVLEGDQLNISYQSAAEFIKYRLFYGHGSIINASIVQSHLHVKVKDPSKVSKKLVEAVRMCNRSDIEKYVKVYIESISEESYYQAIAYCTQIVSELSKNFNNFISLDEQIQIVNRINNSETLKEISSSLWGLCERICLLIEESAKQHNDQKNLDIVEKVEAYVKSGYQDPNFSLNTISTYINLSPGYVGKLFKTYKCISFNEYLTSLRLEKSKFLLETTSESISKICHEVGIYNENYFFTLFKKSFGVTPSNYRNNKLRNPEQLGRI